MMPDALPVVRVRLPPISEAIKTISALALSIVTLPEPCDVKSIVPVTVVVPRSITPLLASVVAIKLPPTVTLPLSMMPDALPLVTVRSPSMVEAPILRAVVPPSIVTSASVPDASFVVIVIAPVKAFDVLFNVIVASFALVVNVVVPVIVSAAFWVMFPVVAVTV